MTLTKQQFLDKIPDDNHWRYVKIFLEKFADDTQNFSEYYAGLRVDNFNIGGRNFLIRLDTCGGYVQFVDELVHFGRFANVLGREIIYDWTLSFRKLYDDILYENNFYLVEDYTGGKSDYMWFTVTSSAYTFREDKLFKSLEMWSEFNKEKRKKFNLKRKETHMGDNCSSCGLELQIHHEMGKDFFEEIDDYGEWIICKECKDSWWNRFGGDRDYYDNLNHLKN